MLPMAEVTEPQLEEQLGLGQQHLEKLDVVVGALVGKEEQLASVPAVRILLGRSE